MAGDLVAPGWARWGAWGLLAAFLAYFGWEAAFHFPSSFNAAMSEAWSRLILADLYVGLAIFAAWVCWREPRRPVAAAWAVAILVLGNAATLAYLLIALRRSRA